MDTYQRPDDAIPHTGNYYYPSGVPPASDTSSIYHNIRYKDTKLNSFWVIYTEAQAKQLTAIIGTFAPYVPFYAGIIKI